MRFRVQVIRTNGPVLAVIIVLPVFLNAHDLYPSGDIPTKCPGAAAAAPDEWSV